MQKSICTPPLKLHANLLQHTHFSDIKYSSCLDQPLLAKSLLNKHLCKRFLAKNYCLVEKEGGIQKTKNLAKKLLILISGVV